jgi:hypothetical protein
MCLNPNMTVEKGGIPPFPAFFLVYASGDPPDARHHSKIICSNCGPKLEFTGKA